jgi:hypothetical protein
MLEILKFIFSDFWIWFGTFLLIAVMFPKGLISVNIKKEYIDKE